jgi:hypothetical protein
MACIDARIGDLSTLDEVVGDCKQQLLLGLSPAVCCHLAKALARQLVFRQQHYVKRHKAGSAYCSSCMATTGLYKTAVDQMLCRICNNTLL